MRISRIFLVILFIVAVGATSFAQNGHAGFAGPGQHENRAGEQLTDEQKQELHDLISGMREDGATREEIKQAVDALFTEWGIERPGRGDRKGGRGFADPQLTEEQREAVQAKVTELRQAGATREDIHAAIEALYAEWGLDMPEKTGRWGDLLTDEQQTELKSLVEAMKESGATREEIKAAVDALFDEWGIEPPAGKERQGRYEKGRKAGRLWMNQLTEEQRTTIRELIQDMKADGATREEIREAVNALLEEWGIDGEENGPDGAERGRERKNIQASNAPNPFNPTTTITYSLAQAGPVSVKVYNMQGQLIRTLVDSHVSEGQHSVAWNGLNDKGEQVSSGMYFYKVTSNNETTTERMMLMK